ncbi:hypothetical protein Q3G72_000067 [Acer saccharum]|nr:hypothetical protein Q3G72_000067 [Acer saccharum]
MEQISGEMKLAGNLQSTAQLLHAIERQSRLLLRAMVEIAPSRTLHRLLELKERERDRRGWVVVGVEDDGRLKVDDDGIGRLMMMIQIGPIVREANIASEGNLDQVS